LAQQYFDGSVVRAPITLAIRPVNSSEHEVRFNAVRGFYYKLQSTTNLAEPFVDEPGGLEQAFESSVVRLDATSGSGKFYRVISSQVP
jgi:hypothetical protein